MMTPDGLEEKLKTAFHNCGMAHDVWAEVAAVARAEMSAIIATDLEARLKRSLGDLAVELYRPGIELVVALLRREPGPSDAEVSALITAALEPGIRTSLAGPDEIRAWITRLPKPDDED